MRAVLGERANVCSLLTSNGHLTCLHANACVRVRARRATNNVYALLVNVVRKRSRRARRYGAENHAGAYDVGDGDDDDQHQ